MKWPFRKKKLEPWFRSNVSEQDPLPFKTRLACCRCGADVPAARCLEGTRWLYYCATCDEFFATL